MRGTALNSLKVNADTRWNENRAATMRCPMGIPATEPLHIVRTKTENRLISDSSPIRSGFELKVNEKTLLTGLS